MLLFQISYSDDFWNPQQEYSFPTPSGGAATPQAISHSRGDAGCFEGAPR